MIDRKSIKDISKIIKLDSIKIIRCWEKAIWLERPDIIIISNDITEEDLKLFPEVEIIKLP